MVHRIGDLELYWPIHRQMSPDFLGDVTEGDWGSKMNKGDSRDDGDDEVGQDRQGSMCRMVLTIAANMRFSGRTGNT